MIKEKEPKYIDLSIVPTHKLELHHIVKKIKEDPYSHIAFDY